MSLTEYTPKEITLQQFHNLLADSYAVSVNDILYFVGHDVNDNPYIADDFGDDYVDLSSVDGSIEVHPYYVFFYRNGKPMQMSFLQLTKIALTDA